MLKLAFAFAWCGFIFVGHAFAAGGIPTATVHGNPNIILADGRSQSTITVNLDDGSGHAPPDGTEVHFVTTSGFLSSEAAAVSGGVARITLTSSPIAGTATVTASFIASNGSATGSTVIEFTSDASLANTDQVASNWIHVSSNEYLAYCADFRTVDAAAKHRGVRIVYRGVVISASAAQVDLDLDVVKAQDAEIEHGNAALVYVDSLNFNLDNEIGQGIQADAPGTHTLQQVTIGGDDFKATVMKSPDTDSNNDYDFKDMSAGHVLISASSINAQPHNQIQLARASIYMDGKHVVSVPNQVMPIDTDQPFGKQIIGYGTDGFYLDVPYYSTLSPKETGVFSFRSQPAAVQAGTDYAGRPAYALDYDRSFSDGTRTSDFTVLGLSTANWGVRWTASQRLAGGTQAYFYVDSPAHQSIFSSANLRHDFRTVALDLDLNSTQPISGNTTSSTQNVAANLSAPVHVLLGSTRHGLLYSEEANYNYSQVRSDFSNASFSSMSASHSLGVRMYTPPIIPGRGMTLTDSVSFDQTYLDSSPGSALKITGNLQLNATPSRYSHTSVSLSYFHNPIIGAAPQPIVTSGGTLIGTYYQTDSESLNWSYNASAPHGIWNLLVGTTYGLPSKNMTMSSSLNYRLSSQMHLSLGNYYS